MAANGRGYMRPSSAGRTPPFLIIGLLIVISILAFNYWSLSSKNNALTREIDEAEMKYRSVQVRKLDVEKRNAELSALLDEAKKYKQEAQEKDMRLREAEQKEKELNSKLDNLAGEAEVLKNDLNTCDDEVGFCHENITKMIITHKKALEEAQMNCNMKVDEARSSAEQRAASVEKLDVQQSQLVQTQPVLQQGQQQQQPLNEQQQQQQEQKQMLQEQQQPLQEQTHLEQQQSPQEQQQQQQQQPQQSFQEQQQPQLQQVPQEQQPQLQQLPQERLQQKIPQEQPQLQEHLKEQLPKDQLQQPEQQVEGALQQLQQQQQLPNIVEQNKEEHLEQKQEPIVLQGLSQTSDLARAVQEGYKNMPLEVQQQMATVQQQQQSQQPQQQLQQISAAQSVLEQKPENLQPYVQQEAKPVLPGDDLQDHHMTGLERHDPDVQPVPNEVAPAGHASVQDSIDGAQEKELEVTKDRVLDLDQRRDQAAYLANDAAPVGQAVGAEIVVAAQQSLSPLSIQVLNEHYQLPEELDSNLRSELSKAEHDLKTQLAFSEEKLHIGSLKELLKSASQQSVINLRRFPADGHFPETNTKVTDIDTNHSTAHLSNIHSSNDANNLHGVSSLSANLVGKNSLPNVFDKNAPSNRDQVEHNIDEQEFGSISMIEDSDNDHYEKAVSKILSKESLLDLPELDSMLYKDNTDGRLMEEEDAIQKEQVESAGPKKTFSHGFLYLNLSQLLESSDLDDDFMDESNGRREGDSVDDDDEDLFLDGTTNHYEATTENGYSTEAHDWAETTKPSMDFDAVNIPLDRFDNQEEAPGRVGEGENVSGQHLISGQLPKAVDTHQHYNTLEDQLRLPVNDNGQVIALLAW